MRKTPLEIRIGRLEMQLFCPVCQSRRNVYAVNPRLAIGFDVDEAAVFEPDDLAVAGFACLASFAVTATHRIASRAPCCFAAHNAAAIMNMQADEREREGAKVAA